MLRMITMASYFDVRVPASHACQVQMASFEFVETSGGG